MTDEWKDVFDGPAPTVFDDPAPRKGEPSQRERDMVDALFSLVPNASWAPWSKPEPAPTVFDPGDSPLRVLGRTVHLGPHPTVAASHPKPSETWNGVGRTRMPDVLSIDLARQTITITMEEWHDLRRRAEPLSAAWHHWPCVTTGLPDHRKAHPIVAAIGRKGGRA